MLHMNGPGTKWERSFSADISNVLIYFDEGMLNSFLGLVCSFNMVIFPIDCISSLETFAAF